MKPRIRLSWWNTKDFPGYRWICCADSIFCGYGATPKEAFDAWDCYRKARMPARDATA